MSKVSLISWTEKPIETMMFGFTNQHHPVGDDLDTFVRNQINRCGYERWGKIREDFIRVMAHNPHASVLEYVNTTWKLDEVTRAFQQQLTRTRTASYSIQSLRIVDVGKFAENEQYAVPYYMRNRPEALKVYQDTMLYIQESYKKLADMGIKLEDARGVLPLNIYSPITMSINLRALSHMLEARLCYLTQGEFQLVAQKMVEEISVKIDPALSVLFMKPCDRIGKCPMPVNCNKTQYKTAEAYKSIDVEYWLKDADDRGNKA